MHPARPSAESTAPTAVVSPGLLGTGKWRARANGSAPDTRGDFYDGTPITSPFELQSALLRRPIPLVRTFTSNLMAYALGRRVEHFDQPTIREIVRDAQEQDYRMSSFFIGVVMSDAFRMQSVPVSADDNQ